MKFIVINSSKNSGKTHTLNYLILKLLSNGYNVIYSDKTILNAKTDKEIEKFCSEDKIVDFKIKDKIVRIIAFGDSQKLMENAFDKSKSIDLYVCASRSKGSTCSYIKEQAGDSTILWHKKWKVTSSNSIENLDTIHERINHLQADELYSEILESL
ncbi:hypothetical protein [uncultured Eubacterium sp.]|uniref:hypothetical protein n=1 Tax=uncultured Eubacterium sp. TaxID=165185 RepID=UPI0015AC4C3C|nr:hypothetical protein [uncultured Eubacterium sp.]